VVHFLDNLPLDECDDRSIDRASKLATQEGIEVEIGTRSTDPEHLLNYLKIAQRMNARLIRTPTRSLATWFHLQSACILRSSRLND
jgi:hypothetical protein